jgi:hypothetical protein
VHVTGPRLDTKLEKLHVLEAGFRELITPGDRVSDVVLEIAVSPGALE